MNRIRAAVTGVVAIGLLITAGCTDDPGSTASTAPSTVVSTTVASISSAAPTSPPSTTPLTSATTSTPLATTTTVDQVAATKAAVVAAVASARANYLYAVRNYDAADALSVLGSTTVLDSPSYSQAMSTLR